MQRRKKNIVVERKQAWCICSFTNRRSLWRIKTELPLQKLCFRQVATNKKILQTNCIEQKRIIHSISAQNCYRRVSANSSASTKSIVHTKGSCYYEHSLLKALQDLKLFCILWSWQRTINLLESELDVLSILTTMFYVQRNRFCLVCLCPKQSNFRDIFSGYC